MHRTAKNLASQTTCSSAAHPAMKCCTGKQRAHAEHVGGMHYHVRVVGCFTSCRSGTGTLKQVKMLARTGCEECKGSIWTCTKTCCAEPSQPAHESVRTLRPLDAANPQTRQTLSPAGGVVPSKNWPCMIRLSPPSGNVTLGIS